MDNTQAGNRTGTQGSQGSMENMAGQAQETAGRWASSASEYAQDAYERGADYVRQQREHYPGADRYLREGSRYLSEPVRGNPLLSIMLAGALGYGLAYLIHGANRDQREELPRYARSRSRYDTRG